MEAVEQSSSFHEQMNVRVKNKMKAALDKVHRYRLRHGNRTEKSRNIRESLDKFTWEQHFVDETLQLGCVPDVGS